MTDGERVRTFAPRRRVLVGVVGEVGQLAVGQLETASPVELHRAALERVADRLAQAARAGVEHHVHAASLVGLDLEEVVARAERPEQVDHVVEPGRGDRGRRLEPDSAAARAWSTR